MSIICLPPGVLYLLVIEGGQGLINLEARVKTMRLQILQKLLYCSDKIPWIALGLSVLQNIWGISLDKQFLIEKHFVSKVNVSFLNLYVSVFKTWQPLEHPLERMMYICYKQKTEALECR